jgi:membrane-associated phospholipid phosphatase
VKSVFVVAAAALVVAQPAAARNVNAWNDAGSAVRTGLVVAALGLPALKQDWRGDLQAGASLAGAGLLTLGLKEAFPELRPDRSDRKSFPSGHTSISFAAAASLQNRYGWEVGVPAQLLAAFVGVSRVEARKHHWYDVVVGAGIGEASGFLLTSKHDSRVRILPWGDSHGGGVVAAVAF